MTPNRVSLCVMISFLFHFRRRWTRPRIFVFVFFLEFFLVRFLFRAYWLGRCTMFHRIRASPTPFLAVSPWCARPAIDSQVFFSFYFFGRRSHRRASPLFDRGPFTASADARRRTKMPSKRIDRLLSSHSPPIRFLFDWLRVCAITWWSWFTLGMTLCNWL